MGDWELGAGAERDRSDMGRSNVGDKGICNRRPELTANDGRWMVLVGKGEGGAPAIKTPISFLLCLTVSLLLATGVLKVQQKDPKHQASLKNNTKLAAALLGAQLLLCGEGSRDLRQTKAEAGIPRGS